jgi:hypothetical protein
VVLHHRRRRSRRVEMVRVWAVVDSQEEEGVDQDQDEEEVRVVLDRLGLRVRRGVVGEGSRGVEGRHGKPNGRG